MKESFGVPKPPRVERGPEKESVEKKPDGMSRRAFLRGMLNSAVAAAVASSAAGKLAEAAPGYEKTPLSLADELFFKELLENPERLARFQEDPKMEEVDSLVRALARADIGWAEKLRAGSDFHPGAGILIDRDRNFRGNGVTVRIEDTSEHSTTRHRYFVVTAKHVAEVVPSPNGEPWVEHPKGYDIAVVEVEESTIDWIKDPSGKKSVLDVMDFDMTRRAVDEISGEAGIVLAHNTRGKGFQRHAYASRISPPLTEKVRDALNWGRPLPEHEKYFKDFRLIALPPGYSEGELKPASGTSGAAFVMWDPATSQPELGGIMAAASGHRIAQKDAKGNMVRTTYALGEILDREIVREAIEHAMKAPLDPMRSFADPKLRR